MTSQYFMLLVKMISSPTIAIGWIVTASIDSWKSPCTRSATCWSCHVFVWPNFTRNTRRCVWSVRVLTNRTVSWKKWKHKVVADRSFYLKTNCIPIVMNLQYANEMNYKDILPSIRMCSAAQSDCAVLPTSDVVRLLGHTSHWLDALTALK